MLFFLTKRRIVKRLHKSRWEDRGFWADNMSRYNRGIPRDEFVSFLFTAEFDHSNKLEYWFKTLLGKMRPNFLRTFDAKVNYIIERCIDEEYIGVGNNTMTQNLIVKDKGLQLITPLYYFQVFFGNAYIKAIVISILGVLVTTYITEMVIEKTSDAIVDAAQYENLATSTESLLK